MCFISIFVLSAPGHTTPPLGHLNRLFEKVPDLTGLEAEVPELSLLGPAKYSDISHPVWNAGIHSEVLEMLVG